MFNTKVCFQEQTFCLAEYVVRRCFCLSSHGPLSDTVVSAYYNDKLWIWDPQKAKHK